MGLICISVKLVPASHILNANDTEQNGRGDPSKDAPTKTRGAPSDLDTVGSRCEKCPANAEDLPLVAQSSQPNIQHETAGFAKCLTDVFSVIAKNS